MNRVNATRRRLTRLMTNEASHLKVSCFQRVMVIETWKQRVRSKFRQSNRMKLKKGL